MPNSMPQPSGILSILCFSLLIQGSCCADEEACFLQGPGSPSKSKHLASGGTELSQKPEIYSTQHLVQIIALDTGILHGPANTILAAKRAVEAGSRALNVDAVLSGRRLVAAHNATHRLRSGGFPTFMCGSLPDCTPRDLERELSPSCHFSKHYYLESGVPSSALTSLKFCQPQRLNFIEDFLEQFPETPIIFDMKSETVPMQHQAVKILHKMLETSFPDRPSNLTTLRVFVPPADLLKIFDTGPWKWPRFKLAIGIPKADSWCTDAWDVLPHMSKQALKHVAAVFVAPQQLEDSKRFPKQQELPLVCDLGIHEAACDWQSFDHKMHLCVRHGASVVHTGRVAAVANFLNVTQLHQTDKMQKREAAPHLFKGKPGLVIVKQEGPEKAVHYWSSTGLLESGSVWTRCAGKLATSLLVLRLVELKLLPGLDEPIVPILKLSGKWFRDWKQHPVMKKLTLRHVMGSVGGLPSSHYKPDWIEDRVRSPIEVAERVLSLVNSSFVLGGTFDYSNMQWAIVELAVQRATGMDWPAAAQKFLFQPLGLSEYTYYRSEDKPACFYGESSKIYERNLRAGIGLCSTPDDMFLMGITLRKGCPNCFLSKAGMKEVIMDQLATHFPSAVESFFANQPEVSFTARGIELTGRGFAGFTLKGGWFLAHGGAASFYGQNVLVQTKHGAAGKDSKVMVSFISDASVPYEARNVMDEQMFKFMDREPAIPAAAAAGTALYSEEEM